MTNDAAISSTTGFFGRLSSASPAPAADEEIDNAQKRQIDEQTHAQPTKKARLSNGYENVFETTAMDVDDEPNQTLNQNQAQNHTQNGDENPYPSPEQLPSPVAITAGPSEGTQVERVHNLSGDTTFLELSNDPSSASTVLLQCEFNPQDPTILAAAGTDALARMWTLSRMDPDSGSDSPGKPIFAPHRNLLDDNVSPASVTVTGVSWSPDGTVIAVASEPTDDSSAKVEFWTRHGESVVAFNQFDSPIICHRWNTTSTNCLVLSPLNEGRNTSITVMSPNMGSSIQYTLLDHSLLNQPLDAAWINSEEFVLCGGDILQSFKIETNVIQAGQKFNTQEGDALSKITYDGRSRMIATANDSGTIHVCKYENNFKIMTDEVQIWNNEGEHRSLNAHQGTITSLMWQPITSPADANEETERLIVSSGEDGAISIWNARSTETKPKFSMTMNSGVVAMAFTNDGAFLAGGTNQNVFIWSMNDVKSPVATWARGDNAGCRTPQSTDSSADEDQFSMCWDSLGQRLAYGVNSRVSKIHEDFLATN